MSMACPGCEQLELVNDRLRLSWREDVGTERKRAELAEARVKELIEQRDNAAAAVIETLGLANKDKATLAALISAARVFVDRQFQDENDFVNLERALAQAEQAKQVQP